MYVSLSLAALVRVELIRLFTSLNREKCFLLLSVPTIQQLSQSQVRKRIYNCGTPLRTFSSLSSSLLSHDVESFSTCTEILEYERYSEIDSKRLVKIFRRLVREWLDWMMLPTRTSTRKKSRFELVISNQQIFLFVVLVPPRFGRTRAA